MKTFFNFLTKPIGRRSFLKGMLGVFAVGGAGVGRGYANTKSYNIRLEKVEIPLKRLPSSFRGFKIAQLSDLHSSPIVPMENLRQAAELVLVEKPDLIVLTGDFIGHAPRIFAGEIHEFEPQYVKDCVEALSILNAPHGLFAVLGNHDFWSGPEAVQTLVRDFEEELGIRWLRNRNSIIEKGNDRIVLAGVDDYWEKSCSLGDALKNAPEDTARILLSHNPDINEIMFDSHKVDLILSGHTHGGQVKFPLIGTPFNAGVTNSKYLSGLVRDGDRQTYITRGIGHLVAPIRFLCPPEATLITLI